MLPVGGLLLGESFIEPLSGRMAHVGGGSIRGGKVVPHAGGFQALLNSQTLGARVRVVEMIRAYCDEWKSGSLEPHNEISRVRAAAADLEQAWRNSQHCMLQLLSCLESQQEWAWWVAEDGGSLGVWVRCYVSSFNFSFFISVTPYIVFKLQIYKTFCKFTLSQLI